MTSDDGLGARVVGAGGPGMTVSGCADMAVTLAHGMGADDRGKPRSAAVEYRFGHAPESARVGGRAARSEAAIAALAEVGSRPHRIGGRQQMRPAAGFTTLKAWSHPRRRLR